MHCNGHCELKVSGGWNGCFHRQTSQSWDFQRVFSYLLGIQKDAVPARKPLIWKECLNCSSLDSWQNRPWLLFLWNWLKYLTFVHQSNYCNRLAIYILQGFLPGGIQPERGLALPALVWLSLFLYLNKKQGLRCLSPVFLRKGLNCYSQLRFSTHWLLQ